VSPFRSHPAGGSNLHTAPSATNTEADGRRVDLELTRKLIRLHRMRQEKLGAKPLLYLRKPLKRDSGRLVGMPQEASEELLMRRFRVRFPGGPPRTSCSGCCLTLRRQLIVYAVPADPLRVFRVMVDGGSG